MKKIYFDNAATTPVDPRVLKAMLPYFTNDFGNASSIHSWGQKAEATILKAKDIIARFLDCFPEEIIFTSGATESNNMVLKGLFGDYKGHLIVSALEHPSVLETAKWLESKGVEVSFIKPEKNGLIDYKKVFKVIKKDTRLISIMYANNEIGTIQPIGKIGKKLEEINQQRKNKILFHSDAVQAVYFLPMSIKRLRVDFLSLSGHKIYGPQGVGALYIKKNIKITPLLHGGHQENGLRAGTYNLPGIVGLSQAISLLNGRAQQETISKIKKLRDNLIQQVLKIKGTFFSGDLEHRLPNNANFLFKNIEGESLLLRLDMAGIAVSTGSACASGSLKPSHVLLSMGIKPEDAHSSLRVSIGKNNTQPEIDRFVRVLKKELKNLRKFSPFK